MYYESSVGNYDAKWDKIEAEWFFRREGKLVKRECPAGGFEIQNIHNNDYLVFQYVRNMKNASVFLIRLDTVVLPEVLAVN
jgi:arabinoxylan arabinofuranohydrolase